ncbi:serine O-acetyltransferase [Inhella inkyongensis]|uniref:Serine acetyltransferase n=1 Tax=Inhella inkyongensis TaxID=392593 RepID=A0A840S470_9BURK|nr:serine acetyltransferase [Inhella inkyongensis]MBB5204352.1 serine O-acetyltransferase [Inhella inkyongensis]
MKADVVRQFGHASAFLVLRAFVMRRTFRPVLTLRLCQAASRQWLGRCLALPVLRLLHRWSTGTACMDLPWSTRIGPGLAITHGWGLVINENAQIGANVTLFHGVTLGRSDRIGADGVRVSAYPVLEDEVWVGPHAVIVGGVTIGRGSRIAAGAVVTRDVPAHSMVVGNPATITKERVISDVMNAAEIPSLPTGTATEV